MLAGPHATRVLRDLGADVITVEPPGGAITRFTMPRVNGIATCYVLQDVGKRNASIDLSRPEGVELAARLAERCDVVVDNFRPGVMDRLGPEDLRARNPALVYASISGYGSSGPLRDKRACNVVLAAEDGLTKFQSDARGGATRAIRPTTRTCTRRWRRQPGSSPRWWGASARVRAPGSTSRWPTRCSTSTTTSTTSSTTASCRRAPSAASGRPTTSC